jgi:hypothetical protein
VLLLPVLLAGCGGSSGYVVLQPDGGWPTETLRDWVSFGDQLSVIRVVDETGPATPPDYKNSGGVIGRRVSARIERTLWRRPGAPRAPRLIRFNSWGWMMESDQDPNSPRAPVVGEHEPRLEVGRRYLAVLVRDNGEWFAVGQATMTLAANDTVTSEVVAGGPVAGAAALRGKSIERAAATVAATSPRPGATRYRQLPPRERLEKIARGGA